LRRKRHEDGKPNNDQKRVVMKEIRATIDGKELCCPEGTTILAAAEAVGIQVPHLCRRPDLTPTGNCRLCVVEVEGAQRLVASCHTPIAEGMVVRTQSRKVRCVRKVIVELLLAGHTGPCVNDVEIKDCELHQIAAELEVGPPRFHIQPRHYPAEETNPYVRRDMSKCVLCRRCVAACREIAKKDILSVAYRGFHSKVVVGLDQRLDLEVCKDCGVCIDYCPTSALTKPRKGVG
jgi:NADH dehydrogenase/NADH:ubiquinone oxidoreductase subunit G